MLYSNSERGRPDCLMMESKVPVRSSLWSGTRTVTVDSVNLNCIAIWYLITGSKKNYRRMHFSLDIDFVFG